MGKGWQGCVGTGRGPEYLTLKMSSTASLYAFVVAAFFLFPSPNHVKLTLGSVTVTATRKTGGVVGTQGMLASTGCRPSSVSRLCGGLLIQSDGNGLMVDGWKGA